ncbi:MAG: alpha/beta fold hydrolase [Pseudomonadota bacterium]
MRPALALAAFVALAASAAHAGCGEAEAACEIDGGTYHIELPETPAEGAPALVFLHGWGSSGEGALRVRGMVETALSRGYAVIAPDGVPRTGRSGRTWGFHPELPGPRDEVAFLMAVRDDAAERFGLGAGNMVLAGFSIGGSMTAYAACAAPDGFAAFAPLSGNFWRPHPEICAGPVRMIHVHGWTDGTVPLEGRILRGGGTDPDAAGVLAQGDIWQALQIWRATNACRPNAHSYADLGDYWVRSWTDCAPGSQLSMALFYGGHGIPGGWTDLVLDWFEDVSG